MKKKNTKWKSVAIVFVTWSHSTALIGFVFVEFQKALKYFRWNGLYSV